jgi:hypothetical protein
MKFTAEEKCKEAKREVGMRKRVYAHSAMDPQEAKRKIEIMEEIAADYEKLAQQERLL